MRRFLLIAFLLAWASGTQAQEVETFVADTASFVMERDMAVDSSADEAAPSVVPSVAPISVPEFKPYEPPKALDFNFIKSRTNPVIKPYKFLDDQTWVGIPVFATGLIAKAEKTAFRQDYNNPSISDINPSCDSQIPSVIAL